MKPIPFIEEEISQIHLPPPLLRRAARTGEYHTRSHTHTPPSKEQCLRCPRCPPWEAEARPAKACTKRTQKAAGAGEEARAARRTTAAQPLPPLPPDERGRGGRTKRAQLVVSARSCWPSTLSFIHVSFIHSPITFDESEIDRRTSRQLENKDRGKRDEALVLYTVTSLFNNHRNDHTGEGSR